LDGDADRLIVADETGAILDGDQVMALVARTWNARQTLTGGGVVATVMSNLGLERYLQGIGLDLVRTQVGDRYVLEHMRKHGYNLGGEQSGHIILSEYTTTGDGLIAALQVLAARVEGGVPLSEIGRAFTPYPQILRNVSINGGAPLESDEVKRAIADGEASLGDEGRVLIRPSGTEPLIRVMAEGLDEARVSAVVDTIVGAIEQAGAGH
jgi:phosphoglucosamine mutase